MNHRERVRAVMHYESYDRLPCVAFGYWTETLDKWAAEGHVRRETAELYKTTGDNGPADREVMDQLGFDFSWQSCVNGRNALFPAFESKVLRVEKDGSRVMQDGNGHLVRVKPGLESIPGELGTLLTGREAWEREYLPRLQYSDDRIPRALFKKLAEESAAREYPLWLHCGSLYGTIRDMLGVVELSYLQVDDEDLYKEIIDTMADLALRVAEESLKCGVAFDGAHFWEDICFKNGPLVNPEVFAEYVGPHYRRFADLLASYGIDQISLDCDGCIDKLLPIWLENGVNTMFPIEVGTWGASIAPWRAKYGRALKGVGGMDKRVFSQDRAAVEAEIERLKPLVDLGGYIPCPDHRIPPDAKYELVAYYCELFRKAF
ncbi:MAG: hypothetical protein IKO07_03030 [Clostridia bacterium]|nr:hypothetical protein [Clostridia bacterium]